MSSRRKLSYDELSIINRASTIMTSSLEVSKVFSRFVTELKKIIDINWAAVALVGNDELYSLALFSEPRSSWKAGKRIPVINTATEWVVLHKKPLVESDLSQKSQFVTGGSFSRQGIRSLACLPLITKARIMGSLLVASRRPDAYGLEHIAFLERVAAQIAMPVVNSLLYAEMKEQARVDKLTGLFNRRSLDEVIVAEINRHARYGGVLSLIMLDVDSLKKVNDECGHLAGDDVLRKVGDAIRSSIRSTDQAFRYGGDEFAILLPNTVLHDAGVVAERIRDHVASTLTVGGVFITASIGVATWPANGTVANDLITAADGASYRAKKSGGNRCLQA